MKQNSPYTATITGCGFLYYEFLRILPLLMSKDSTRLLKEEIDNNLLFQVNSQKARLRFLAEFKRRYNALPISFWNDFLKMNELSQRAGLLYVILKTYRLIFDFHFNVTVKRWNSVDQRLCKTDIMMELSDLSSRDPFVDSWTDNTKSRCASQYLTILRQAGLLQEKTNKLLPIHLPLADYEYFIFVAVRNGFWKLACFILTK